MQDLFTVSSLPDPADCQTPTKAVPDVLPDRFVPPSISTDSKEQDASRTDIAKSLGAKDPSWFRQTADRGTNSAALRKTSNQSEDTSYATPLPPTKRQLLGLARESSVEPVKVSPQEDFIASTSALMNSPRDSHSSLFDAQSSGTPKITPDKSPLPTIAAQRFDPPGMTLEPSLISTDTTANPDAMALPSAQRRSSPDRFERPASPTKGMGGFVQSAMLKRSDSVSKRWTVNTGGQSRPISIASVRVARPGSVDDSQAPAHHNNSPKTLTSPYSRESTPGRENTIRPSSRPSPSTSQVRPTTPKAVMPSRDRTPVGRLSESPSMKSTPTDNRASHSSKTSIDRPERGRSTDMTSPPISPSKRWSPTKSSWLERAINKEQPPPKPREFNNQPSWMSDLNKNRQSRMSKDMTNVQISASSTVVPQDGAEKREDILANRTNNSVPSTKPKPARLSQDRPDAINIEQMDNDSNEFKLAHSNTNLIPAFTSKSDAVSEKEIQETSKSHIGNLSKEEKGGPEFLKAFGTLKRTKTERYVAPDVLGENVRRGKAALAETDGPQKSNLKDEFKESLIKQKETIKSQSPERKVQMQAKSRPDPPTPEAIAKKKALGRSDSSANVGNVSKTQTVDEPTTQKSREDDQPKSKTTEMPSRVSPFGTFRGNKLAERFNPGLVSIISRGPESIPKIENKRSEAPLRITASGQNEQTGKLEHMTKSRARGPARRAPKAAASEPIEDKSATEMTLLVPTEKVKPQSPRSSRNITPIKSFTSPASSASSPIATPKRSASTTMSKPQTPPKSPFLGSKSANIPIRPSPASYESSKLSEKLGSLDKPAPSVDISNVESVPLPSTSVRNATAKWGQLSVNDKLPTMSVKAPIKLPSHADEQALMEGTNIVRTSSPMQLSTAEQKSVSPSSLGNKTPEPRSRKETSTADKATPSNRDTSVKVSGSSPSSQTSDAGKLFEEYFTGGFEPMGKLDIDTGAVLASISSLPTKTRTLQKQIDEITLDGKIATLPPSQQHVLYSSAVYVCTHTFSDDTGTKAIEIYLWIGNSARDPLIEEAQHIAGKLAKELNAAVHVLRQGKETARFFQALGGIVIIRRGSAKDISKPFMLCGRHHFGHIAFDEVEFTLTSFCSGFSYIVAHQGAESRKLYLWKGAGCSAEETGCARLISMDLIPTTEVVEIDDGEEPDSFLSLFPAVGPRQVRNMPRSADHWKLKSHHTGYGTRLFVVDQGAQSRPLSRADTIGGAATSMWNSFTAKRRGSQPGALQQTHVEEIAPFAQGDLENGRVYVLDAYFEIYV